jgi:SAM-dependent methyltransferase
MSATASPSPARQRPGLTRPGWNPKTRSLRTRNKYLKAFWKWWEFRQLPAVSGPADLSDLRAPGQVTAAPLPAYYTEKRVHHMEAPGWLHPKMGPRLEQTAGDFPFGSEDNIRAWILDNVTDAGLAPRRILDVACGSGAITFVYAELFPEAEVIGVDLAPSLLRWARLRAGKKGLGNVRFYQADSAGLAFLADDSFDVVHEAHSLHEMPTAQIDATVREMIRVCRPGGLLGFFDWAVPENEQDWEHRRWKVRIGSEPYMLDYAEYDFPSRLPSLGATDVVRVERHSNSATWKARKAVAPA